ncbi:MAG: hypothetical protein CMO01_23380 [Thalassobius sp.]|nr:hypothetical protein [Thalassovita sp.]
MSYRKLLIISLITIFSCQKKESTYENIVVKEKEKLNVIWIIAEDLSPDLSCYGNNGIVNTKNIDQLAHQGMLFNNAFSTSPYGEPSRSAIFTGTYPHVIGMQHVDPGKDNSNIIPPADVKVFTEYLRANGYYCSLRGNTPVPFSEAATTWDQISSPSDSNEYRYAWENRPKDTPFFSTIYLSQTEEKYNLPEKELEEVLAKEYPDLPKSEILALVKKISDSPEFENIKIDKKKIKLPGYLANSNKIKDDFVRMYLNIKRLDNQVGSILQQLKTDKLDKNTVVFFFSENGRGLPGSKRWLYDGGIQVPLIIKFPGVTHGGAVNSQLVSLIDLAPTLLSNLDIRIPEYMQGLVFLGKRKHPAREYIFAARDRIGEADEKLRCIRNEKFKYIRNYTKEAPFDEPFDILDRFPTVEIMKNVKKRRNSKQDEGLVKFTSKKTTEELYDIKNDPNELVNLAERDYFLDDLAAMRKQYNRLEGEIGGFINTPEDEMRLAMQPDSEYELITEAPSFSEEGGELENPKDLNITCSTAGASILYAYLPDGETDIHWKVYHEPILIDQSCTILSKAVRYGFEESAIKSISFKIPNELSAKIYQ